MWKPVDLTLDGVATIDAFERLFAASGLRVKLPKVLSDKKITVRLKGATFWQALDEICRANGNVNYQKFMHYGTHNLRDAAWTERPAWYGGPLRLQVCDSARVREVQYPRRVDRTELALLMQWTPSFVPAQERRLGQQGKLEVTRAEDDTGKSLVPPVAASPDFDRWPSAAMGAPASIWLVRLQPPASAAKGVRIIEGTWTVKCLADVKDVRFDAPEKSVGATREVGPITVTLKSFEPKTEEHFGQKETKYHFTVRLSYDAEKAPDDWKETLHDLPLKARMLPHAAVEVEGGSGESEYVDVTGTGPGWAEFATPWGSDGRPVAITVRVGAALRTVRAAFVLKDIPLPQEAK